MSRVKCCIQDQVIVIFRLLIYGSRHHQQRKKNTSHTHLFSLSLLVVIHRVSHHLSKKMLPCLTHPYPSKMYPNFYVQFVTHLIARLSLCLFFQFSSNLHILISCSSFVRIWRNLVPFLYQEFFVELHF